MQIEEAKIMTRSMIITLQQDTNTESNSGIYIEALDILLKALDESEKRVIELQTELNIKEVMPELPGGVHDVE